MMDAANISLTAGVLDGICDEMGTALQFAALSANIKDRRDFSTAVFDRDGKLVGMGAHMPVHLGAMPSAVDAVRKLKPVAGDIFLLNDPFLGGTHLPDLTVVMPVHSDDTLIGYTACRAHHADIGGPAHGSMTLTDSIYGEGLRIPPVRIFSHHQPDPDVLKLILANVRDPEERKADLDAQVSCCRIGAERLHVLYSRWGKHKYEKSLAWQLEYADELVREFITTLKPGDYEAIELMEDDGFGEMDIRLHCKLSVMDGSLIADMSGSAGQTKGGINAPKAVTLSALIYAITLAAGGDIRPNAGLLRRVELKTKAGTVVDPLPPAACAGGNVETSCRLVELFLELLGIAGADVPAASQGTMNNISMGWGHLNYYETIAGGCGADSHNASPDGTHSHMTNSLNTPVEALEALYPIIIERYSVREGSGGKGIHNGGDGIIREYRFLEPTVVHLFSERRRIPPPGRDGGSDAVCGRNMIIKSDSRAIELPSKGSFAVETGDRLVIETPGGAGWGKTSIE